VARVLLVFLDGVGIGPADPDINPFFRASLPTLTEALGGRLPSLDELRVAGPGAATFPVDACLGVPGTPQSGTGQVALLTGRNAPELFGRHFGPWPPVRLRGLLEEENLLSRARASGGRVIFANAYPAGYPADRASRRIAAVPLAAKAAGVLDRDHVALAAGLAVASEIVNDGWIRHLGWTDLPTVTAREAGANLARLTADADLTVYAHYHTDVAGHRGGMAGATQALELVDAFFSGIISELPADVLLLVVSDHGNIEDVRGGHTLNPSLGIVFGPPAASRELPGRLTGIAGFVLSEIGKGG
jgi:2,3-bisphosphoglycerate-independent phosphoglycerate mutase